MEQTLKTLKYKVAFRGKGNRLIKNIVEDLQSDKKTKVKILEVKAIIHTWYLLEIVTPREDRDVINLIYSYNATDIYKA